MKKLTVIHLVEDMKTGGAERIIADIAEGLDSDRYDVGVWCVTRGGDTADELAEKGITVRILGISSYHNPLQILRLKSSLREASPEIVHTHGYFASVIGRLSARKAGVPVILSHVHSTHWDYKKRHILMERKLSRFTHKIICCSSAVENFVRDFEKIEPGKTTVVLNGVDEARFFPRKEIPSTRSELGLDENALVVGTVSSLTPHKGHKYLIRAASLVKEEFPGVKFLIVGDGPLRTELEDLTNNLNIHPDILFAGIRKDVPKILSSLDVFVLPSSSREGLGLAIIEAMAAEKPVVATDIGGIPEVVTQGETGFLVPPANPEALAKAIVELLQHPEKAKEMGKKGHARFKEKFTKKQMLSEIDALYQSLIRRGKSRDETA